MFCSHCWDSLCFHSFSFFNSTLVLFLLTPGCVLFVFCTVQHENIMLLSVDLLLCVILKQPFLRCLDPPSLWVHLAWEKKQSIKLFSECNLSVTSAKALSLNYICVVFEHVDQASFYVLIVLQPTSMYRITVLLCRWYISLQIECLQHEEKTTERI